ncbi:energy transducer TonB [Variovorax sp. YR216]|uniref:energy transducer TonB n=1 Tax=Variovorax sp. YR216 TaxID=1882828 RepID=UPI0008974CC4|nr:energy transducer TonB [Variovorax sp. YR216]SEA48065.1 outer membrane transport energization protein TonB [Variovorax sp. YR216]
MLALQWLIVSDRFSAPPSALGLSRNVVIAGSVVLFHVAALWALQSGLLRRAAEVVIPVEILSEFVEPPKPKEPPPPPPPPPEPKRQVTKTPPPPRPQAIREPKPAPNAPTGSLEPPPPQAPIAAPAPPEPPAPPPAPPAPPSVQLPSSNADYLQNPKPVYPAMSKRLGEQGKTTVRVLIGVDGLPKQASIFRSSGYERLDEAARQAVMSWRYVPGKRNGVVEQMEFNVPINWVLN